MKIKIAYVLLFITSLYVVWTQFYHLGELPIVQWDESRLAVNAAEMQQSQQYLVSTYEHQPDLYNTKPPLMIWFQVCSIQCFGLNEWAIRLPSALAGVLTIFLVGFMAYRSSNNLYTACLAMLILTTSYGFIQLHCSITGDYDALLALFLLLSFFQCQKFLNTTKRMHLYYFTFFVSLSILTKSAAALIFFPIYMAYFFYASRVKYWKQLAVCLILSLIPFFLFLFLREQAASGYLKAMWENDMGGRFINGKDGHEGAWYYYIQQLFEFRYSWFIWLLPAAILYGLLKDIKELNSISICILVYLFIVSIAGTKLEWYDVPVLPLIALLIALFFVNVIKHTNRYVFKFGLVAILALCLMEGLYAKINFTTNRAGMRLDKSIYTISEKIRNYKGSENLYYYSGTYDAWNYFYTFTNKKIQRVQFDKVQTGTTILTTNSFSDSLQLKFYTLTLDSNSHDKTIRITGIK